MPVIRTPARTMMIAIVACACAPLAGISAKPCRPGCVDAETALVCEGDTARAVRCPASSEVCAAPSCHDGACGYRPLLGEPCGPDGLATCNEGYACIGPRTKLTARHTHTCALADDGKVWCWGMNLLGELGDGTMKNSSFPSPVALPRPAIDVSAGSSHTCAVLDDGSVYCWGMNQYGQSVPASSDFMFVEPTRVDTSGTRFTQVSCAANHTCAVTEQSTVWCWGYTFEGECGVDGSVANVMTVEPVRVPGLDAVRNIDTGLDHTCAVRSGTPSMLCWGSNSIFAGSDIDRKLGPAAEGLAYSASPLPVDFGLPVLNMGIGYESTYAVVANGVTYAWGADVHGQLGISTNPQTSSGPEPIQADNDIQQPSPLPGVAEVLRSDATDQCAKMQDLSHGSRYLCWGSDEHGELGFGAAGGNFSFPKAMTVLGMLSQSAGNLVRGEEHSCFTAEVAGAAEIDCFGVAFLTANGTTDQADQPHPAPVVWDPSRFERLLAR